MFSCFNSKILHNASYAMQDFSSFSLDYRIFQSQKGRQTVRRFTRKQTKANSGKIVFNNNPYVLHGNTELNYRYLSSSGK